MWWPVARKERDALVGHGLVVVLAVLAAVFLAIGIVMRQRATCGRAAKSTA